MQPLHAASPQSPPIALVDLLDRVLDTGVVVGGEITISVAGVDLVRVSLLALVASIRTVPPRAPGAPRTTEEHA